MNLFATQVNIPQVPCQRRHHVIQGQPVETHIIRAITVKANSSLDMGNYSFVGFLDALWNPCAARGQLEEKQVVWFWLVNLLSWLMSHQFIRRQHLQP